MTHHRNSHRQPQTIEMIKWKILDLAVRPGGATRKDVHNRFDSVNRERAKHLYRQMCVTGYLTPCGGGRSPAFEATAAASDEYKAMRPMLTRAAPRHTPTLYHPSSTKLPGIPRRTGAQPPPLPGGLIRGAEPPRPQPATPRAPGQLPPVTVCQGWTHNHRYQVAPGTIVTGEFSRLGVGRYIDGTA